MKHSIFLLFTLLLLFSCRESRKPTAQDAPEPTAVEEPEILVSRDDLVGLWIADIDYYSEEQASNLSFDSLPATYRFFPDGTFESRNHYQAVYQFYLSGTWRMDKDRIFLFIGADLWPENAKRHKDEGFESLKEEFRPGKELVRYIHSEKKDRIKFFEDTIEVRRYSTFGKVSNNPKTIITVKYDGLKNFGKFTRWANKE